MLARLRSWWRQNRKTLRTIGISAACIVAVELIFIVVRLYGTGFIGKTLWDWLNLLGVLAIPAVVGLGAAWYTAQQGKVSDRENTDNQRETALQAYIDKMSELLFEKNLRKSELDTEIRIIARVRTITILFQLDARRIGYVFSFLREAGLMSNQPNSSIISLDKADLSNINLSQANLARADLSGAILSGADLSGAILSGANLSKAFLVSANLSNCYMGKANLTKANLTSANLSGAMLIEADLREANLSHTNLRGAVLGGMAAIPVLVGANLEGATGITDEELEKQAFGLQGATMPDGSKHA